jgi:hypothetical protein
MDALENKSGMGMGSNGLTMHVTTKSLRTAEQLRDVKDFFAKRDTSKFDQKLAQALDGIGVRAARAERDAQDVVKRKGVSEIGLWSPRGGRAS